MEETKIYCDKCKNEVEYYLLPRHNVKEDLRSIVHGRGVEIKHLCEPCMDNLNSLITNAINEWNK